MPNYHIKDGEYTATIYSLIKDDKYSEVIRILQDELDRTQNNRPALSLLAYCYFYTQDYVLAANCYEQLCNLQPKNQEYRLNLAQSYYNAFQFQDALTAVNMIDDPELAPKVLKLEAAIRFREDDLHNTRILVEQFEEDDLDVEINLACIEFKEKNYKKAMERFQSATFVHGYSPELAYAIALCCYELKDYSQALKYISDIIDKGIRDHPELGIGMVTEGLEVRSVGNTLLLHQTALIEACNLKFAIEYNSRNMTRAAEALTDMPPRSEEELDPITLHNQALIHIESDTSDAFARLQYLLSQNPFPPETFQNLLLLYCKYEYYDLAADVLAENAHLTYKYLSQYIFDYFDAIITQQTSSNDAFNKFDVISNDLIGEIRKATKKAQEFKEAENNKEYKDALDEIEELKNKFIPVLMSQAKIFWDKEEYTKVEKLFRRSVEFVGDDDTFKLNVAHTLFMMDGKLEEAAKFYEPIVKKSFDNILDVSAIVLANLCVCYIMTTQNEEAEELMRKVQREEDIANIKDNDNENGNKKYFHTCIINLVIGTLYCSKGNYEFGIGCIIKAMDPYEKNLSVDTWYYCKRCILSMIENLSKRLLNMRKDVVPNCVTFLEQCEIYGRDISITTDDPLHGVDEMGIKNTVAYEARFLRSLLLTLVEN
ncbi:Tetratricopeptide repeat protein 30B [Strongyloides ratti]|uniref:Tetratricopeptide repeat protein 30 n=1 Tax=Strongyloides ratti TaxID=34506 RepID=A0A090LAF4_STRRB|nr:Tetratricopeptide repeat protein 30B [Strongyloides ratti]CEF66746.1 Tetratricopeptide repeat protein 30B [Strongyloides ratti]